MLEHGVVPTTMLGCPPTQQKPTAERQQVETSQAGLVWCLIRMLPSCKEDAQGNCSQMRLSTTGSIDTTLSVARYKRLVYILDILLNPSSASLVFGPQLGTSYDKCRVGHIESVRRGFSTSRRPTLRILPERTASTLAKKLRGFRVAVAYMPPWHHAGCRRLRRT